MPPKGVRHKQFSKTELASLQRVLHRGKVTQDGLCSILRLARQMGDDLPTVVSRKHVHKSNHARFDSICHLEPILLRSGAYWNWPIAEPSRLLTLMISESQVLHDLFAQALARGAPSQTSPWTIVIGYDEFSPGGMFSVGDARKSMNLSYTFLELGHGNTRSDNAWLTPVTVRHTWFDKVDGGWGSMFRQFLRLLLLGPQGFATAGAPVVVGGRHVLIFATIKYMIADLDGHRMSLNSNGANGFRPCLRHCNVLKKNSETAALDPASFVEITCCDPSRFQSANSADVFYNADVINEAHARWSAGRMTKARFKNLEKNVRAEVFAPRSLNGP